MVFFDKPFLAFIPAGTLVLVATIVSDKSHFFKSHPLVLFCPQQALPNCLVCSPVSASWPRPDPRKILFPRSFMASQNSLP